MVEQPLGVAQRAIGVDDFTPGQSRQCGGENGIGRHAGEIDFVHIAQEVVGVDPVDRHQPAQGRAVLAEIGLLQPERRFGRQVQAIGDEAGHQCMNLVEEPAGSGVERVVEIEDPGLDLGQRPAGGRWHQHRSTTLGAVSPHQRCR